MIIRDVKGGKLRLTKTTLTELTGEAIDGDKWTLNLSELNREGTLNGSIELWLHRTSPTYGKVPGVCRADAAKRRIGCRSFTIRTFGHIIRAALALRQKGTKKSK